jgi:hypothetical protein
MILTKQEEDVIWEHRQRVRDAKDLQLKRKNCKHEWEFVVAMHNDSAYDCRLCGETKYE